MSALAALAVVAVVAVLLLSPRAPPSRPGVTTRARLDGLAFSRWFGWRLAISPDGEWIAAGGREDEHLALLRRLDMRSSIVVPLGVAGRTLGALALAVGPSGRTFGADDLRLAEDVGRRAATAIENSLLHRAEHEARTRAELLQGVTERLAGARTQRDVAEVLVREGVSALGAAAGWVALLGPDGRELELMAAVGYPPDVVEEYRSIPVEAAIGAQDILVHGRQAWLESAEEVVARFPQHAPAYGRMGYEALAIIQATRPRMQESVSRGGHIRGLQVYDRSGRPCPRCKTSRIRARGQGDDNRTTYWCPECQR